MTADPDPPEADRQPDIELRRVRADKPADRLGIASAIVALLVSLAVVKPWGDIGVPASAPPRPIFTEAPGPTPEPTDDTPLGLATPICLGTGAWRVASLETWRTQHVRVWRALDPAPGASGPLDPAIPVVPVIALGVEALGFCAPAYGPDMPIGPARIVAWWIDGGEAIDLPLLQVRPDRGTTPYAGLYRPVAECQSSWCPSVFRSQLAGPWTSGRVVFRYTDEADGRVVWFAVDIEVLTNASARLTAPGG